MEDVLAAVVARRLGLSFDEAVVIDRGMNASVHLRPTPVVARVTRIAHLIRPPDAFAGGVALAKALEDRALAPTDVIDPGPHVEAGRYITFWTYYSTAAPASPREAGAALRSFHDAAAAFTGGLRSVDPRPDALRVAEIVGGAEGTILRECAERLTMPSLPQQAIHGDAHFGNCVAGGVWQDFDDACVGPREWDIASMTHRLVVFGELGTEMREALAGYGPYDAKAAERLQPLVVLAITTWGVLARLVDAWSPRTTRRLEWLRERLSTGSVW